MSKTKLPSECTTVVEPNCLPALHPVRVAADDQVGPRGGERPGRDPLTLFGLVGVLGAPVSHHDHRVHRALQGGDVGADPVQRRPGRAVRCAAACSTGWCRPDSTPAAGVSPIESVATKPIRIPSRSSTNGRRASVALRPAPTVATSALREPVQGLSQGALTVVPDVVVGQRNQVESGRVAAPRTAPASAPKESVPWVGRAVAGQRGFEVADGDLGSRPAVAPTVASGRRSRPRRASGRRPGGPA